MTTPRIDDDVGIITLPDEPFLRLQPDIRQRAGAYESYVCMCVFLFYGLCPWPRYLPDLMSEERGGSGAGDTTRAEVGAGERPVNAGLVQPFEIQGQPESEPRRAFDAE